MGEQESTRVRCNLDEVLRRRKMTLTRLSKLTDISLVNLSVLKNDRARAVRFSTLVALCDALSCQPGDLFVVVGEPATH
jgi:putative transcriptional regulator